jgi:hypothetical protein
MPPKKPRPSLHAAILAPLLAIALLPTLAEADSYVKATGHLQVYDPQLGWMPMRGAKVQLMDSDVDDDDTIATIHTDSNGNFTLEGFGGDSGGASVRKPDIYLKIWMLHNGLADITDEIGFTHKCYSDTIEEFTGTYNFGNIYCTYTSPSLLFFRSLWERTKFTAWTGDSFPDGEINVHYPAVENYTYYETVHIKDGSSIYHELGHRIRHALDGDWNHWNGDLFLYHYAWPHDDYTIANEGFAFNEGFAKYHKAQFYNYVLTHYQNWTPISGGDSNEGNVAHELVRLSERICSNGAIAGFSRMYQTLKQNPGSIHSLDEFRQRFEAISPACPGTGSSGQTIINDELVDLLLKTLGEYLDWVDANSTAQWQGRVPAELPREALHIWNLVENERHHWDTTARATYRAMMSDLQRYWEQWFQNGSLADQELAMRARLVTTVAKQRIADLTSIRSVLARDIAGTAPGDLRDFYVGLDAGYQRLISSLQAAQAAPTTGPFPEGIMSKSFFSPMATQR